MQCPRHDYIVIDIRLVGEGLNPEKINIKAFLVSFDAEWYHE